VRAGLPLQNRESEPKKQAYSIKIQAGTGEKIAVEKKNYFIIFY
jgi:hypothetical protein